MKNAARIQVEREREKIQSGFRANEFACRTYLSFLFSFKRNGNNNLAGFISTFHTLSIALMWILYSNPLFLDGTHSLKVTAALISSYSFGDFECFAVLNSLIIKDRIVISEKEQQKHTNTHAYKNKNVVRIIRSAAHYCPLLTAQWQPLPPKKWIILHANKSTFVHYIHINIY